MPDTLHPQRQDRTADRAERLEDQVREQLEPLLRVVRRPPRDWRAHDRAVAAHIAANDPFQLHARIARAVGGPEDPRTRLPFDPEVQTD